MSCLKHKLLIVDDDDRLRRLLAQYLQENSYDILEAPHPRKARQVLKENPCDLLILDVMMPYETGFEFIESIRASSENFASLPILLLTARGETEDRVKGLELGADDYLAKPFEPKELLLRIGKILKRSPSVGSPLEIFGDFRYDLSQKVLYKGEERVYLTSTEETLLHLLILHKGTPLSREELVDLSGIVLSPRTFDVRISRLRKKLEKDVKKPELIKAVRHKGYMFS